MNDTRLVRSLNLEEVYYKLQKSQTMKNIFKMSYSSTLDND